MTQFFFEGESIDREYFIRQGELFGFDVDAYLAALDKLPVFSEQRISYALAFYKVMARFIVEMAEQSLKVIRAKDSLQEKEAYTSFVHNVNIGVYRIALPDRFIHVNRTMAAIFGYESPEELLRHPISDLYVDNKERRSIFEELGKTGTVSDHFLAMKKKDGSIIWASLTARAEYDQNGAMQWVDGVIEDVTQRKKADDELRSFSEIDALTGIFNRRKLNDQLRAETRKARRYGRPLSIIFFDIDHFKRTNDSFGHDVGDQVLQVTVDLVRQRLRQDDLFARYGGDEFVILCPETELEGACALAENIRSSIAQREYSWGGKVTVSAGVVQYDACDLSADAALRRADDALYRAKDEGRNRVKAGIR
jgi:diguanylate cyclase (GGDEF)-like protein/PAS domain S-box-containing protein